MEEEVEDVKEEDLSKIPITLSDAEDTGEVPMDVSFLQQSSPWKTGVMPYEMIFIRKLTGKREKLCNTRAMVRMDNYYPCRPLTADTIRKEVR